MEYRKKLIEVALPLEAINAESAREKSIRHGHPSTLHLWWARRPLATCRAVLWASLVDDPSSWPERFPTEEEQQKERQRLFDILARFETVTDKKGKTKRIVRGLVAWNDINKLDESGEISVLVEAQREIARCLAWRHGEEPSTNPDQIRAYIAENAPPVYDPFAGGGSIPLEAQRLGLKAYASDLNPVAVLINKALIEIPPKYKDLPPVNLEEPRKLNVGQWNGLQGLSDDVRHYGRWMRDQAFEKIGHLYPTVELSQASELKEATIIAWLWARTVKCPNPVCGCMMPLVRSFELSTKKGREIWVKPIIDRSQTPPIIKFSIEAGAGEVPPSPKIGRGATFRCLACNQPTDSKYIKAEGVSGKMDAQLMAIVAKGQKGRVYLPPTVEHERIAASAKPKWYPSGKIGDDRRSLFTPLYGLTDFSHLFTNRQILALSTFCDLIGEVREKIYQDFLSSRTSDNCELSQQQQEYINSYRNAVVIYLAFSIDRSVDRNSTICSWDCSPKMEALRNTFARQAIPMTWDFAEGNPFSNSSGNWMDNIEWVLKVVENSRSTAIGLSSQQDAISCLEYSETKKIVSTDPPYYDNIGYADLSDFFYVWLRHSLQGVYPELFSTLLVPKKQELVASPHRFGGNKKRAKTFFEDGLGSVFRQMHSIAHASHPVTIYYAFKQAETERVKKEETISSTGWETMLEGLIKADFSISGTWPVRTELSNRSVARGSNALSSSIVLVCLPRPIDAPKITRRQFLSELKYRLPLALKTLQQGNIAPVDLAQASIGPGMSIFSQYSAVLESDGGRMSVRTALQLINQNLDEYLTEQAGEFDADTRWALTWYEQYQFDKATYGEAETLSKAKNTSVQGLVEAGILEAESGKVRLLPRMDLPEHWDPSTDNRTPDWEAAQHLIHRLETQGESSAANLLSQLGTQGENARDLAYRLYNLCDRKGWSKEALAYNSLVIAWPEISRLAREIKRAEPVQTTLSV